jgi:hypothetical protein
MDDELEQDRIQSDVEQNAERQREWFAMNLFEYNVTLAARIALGHGIDREGVGAALRSLAYAIETRDVAEDMSPVDDVNTLNHLL